MGEPEDPTIIDWSLLRESPDQTFEEAALRTFLEAQDAMITATNAAILQLLAAREQQARPWIEEHPFAQLRRNEWTIGLIGCYEKYYLATKNPVVVFLARQAQTQLVGNPSPEAYTARLKWIDDYFDSVSRRMTEFANKPPSSRDRAIANALGFEPVGRGPGSEFSGAKQAMADIRIGVAVDLRLPFNNGKKKRTCEEVGSWRQSWSNIYRAYERYRDLIRDH